MRLKWIHLGFGLWYITCYNNLMEFYFDEDSPTTIKDIYKYFLKV